MEDEKALQSAELTAVAVELRSWMSWSQDAGLVSLGQPASRQAGSPSAQAAQAAAASVRGPPAQPAAVRAAAAESFRAAPAAGASGSAAAAAAPQYAAAAPQPAAATSQPAAGGSLKLPTLQQVRDDLGECTRCKLAKGRTKIVFGVGSPKARLVFVGEAPGEDEDLQGEPFVGKAGQLLTKMINAMGLSRDDVYICNTVKCRPPNNRNPEPDELSACEPFLKGQLAALKAEVIVTLGKFAAQALLRDQTAISRLRGEWREYNGIPLMPTFHPAYLLRSPGEKGKVWSDLQLVMKKLELPPVKGGSA